MGLFNWFKSSKQEELSPSQQQQLTWDPNSLTMHQPPSPNAPIMEPVVTQQPNTRDSMQTNLRGGAGGGDICCGVCTGLLCFECCEDCC